MESAETVIALSGIDRSDVTAVERIKHGLTNESWLVSSASEQRVVRISNTEDESLQINRSSEAIILATVGHTGIGPEVIVCDPDRRLLVTRYMGEIWSDADTQQQQNIDRIAMLLRKLHALTAPAGVQRVDLLEVVDRYLRTLDTHGMVCEMTTLSSRERARDVAMTLCRDAVGRLCHNDVHALNIVACSGSGSLRLIDWEYAGLGEPLFDLASISVYHRYDRSQRARLLSGYLPRVDPADWQRLELACWLFDYIRDLWMAVRGLGDEGVRRA